VVRVFRFIVGVLVLSFGLSLSRSWLLAPSAASVPFVGLALAAVGAALVATSFGRGRRRASVSASTVAAGAAVAATGAVLALKVLLEDVEKKKETERQMALLKLKQLEAEYNAKKHLLTPEQRAYWEATIADLKQRLGA
jgi:uncharacterized membrane protein HdeD (DUF308 family)